MFKVALSQDITAPTAPFPVLTPTVVIVTWTLAPVKYVNRGMKVTAVNRVIVCPCTIWFTSTCCEWIFTIIVHLCTFLLFYILYKPLFKLYLCNCVKMGFIMLLLLLLLFFFFFFFFFFFLFFFFFFLFFFFFFFLILSICVPFQQNANMESMDTDVKWLVDIVKTRKTATVRTEPVYVDVNRDTLERIVNVCLKKKTTTEYH